MVMSEFNYHQPVLLEEVLSFLPLKKKLVYVDMTLGRAGHASAILSNLSKGSVFYGFDKDIQAIQYSKKKLSQFEKKVDLHFVQSPYSTAIDFLKNSGSNGADFILFDIGVSSPQFDDPQRGFSYRYDSFLDMRMNQDQELTAYKVINTYTEEQLNHVFRGLGQCENYHRVVKAILETREKKPIETTYQLVDIIKSNLPAYELKKTGHPAKQFFLGIRYEVNGEIDELHMGLNKAVSFLNPGGRIVIITFNSEEDRIVKKIFQSVSKPKPTNKYLPEEKEVLDYIQLTKKPLKASQKELETNNRAKSAILRALERKRKDER